MNNYKSLSPKILEKLAMRKSNSVKCIRRDENHDSENLWRPAYIRDVEKILNSPYYNRYTDKTQVMSMYKNDDISRRAFHVQLVSRIARNIGRLLDLDLDLIEAISLGHDIGHTPFGHAGEDFLNECYFENTGRYFNHNVHSVRVLDQIFKHNISLQTLDGILCHNGEFELIKYVPDKLDSFDEFDKKVEGCYIDKENIKNLISCTLEGCVVRISDMIAYIGKDRQDAIRAGIIKDDTMFNNGELGTHNSVIINNLIVSIVENSFGKNHIEMDESSFLSLKQAKRETYEFIYKNKNVRGGYATLKLMFSQIYNKMIEDLKNENKSAPIYKHHIDFVNNRGRFYLKSDYANTPDHQIVVDYIASMTDDYFIDLYNFLFPKSSLKLNYVSYFNDLTP